MFSAGLDDFEDPVVDSLAEDTLQNVDSGVLFGTEVTLVYWELTEFVEEHVVDKETISPFEEPRFLIGRQTRLPCE